MSPLSRQLYWSGILADFRKSGLTHVQFCQLRRISLHSFRTWLYRLRPGMPPRRPRLGHTSDPAPAAQANPPTFLPVHVRTRPPESAADQPISRPAAPLELVLSDRCHVRVPSGFDPGALHQLLDVLEQRS